MTITASNIESIGHLSARAGVPLHRVQRAIDAIGIKPAMIVDDVIFVAESDAQRVVERLQGRTKE